VGHLFEKNCRENGVLLGQGGEGTVCRGRGGDWGSATVLFVNLSVHVLKNLWMGEKLLPKEETRFGRKEGRKGEEAESHQH